MIQLRGTHIVCELSDCRPEALADLELIEGMMIDAAAHAHATMITKTFHRFTPTGVSGVIVIAESHLSIHTWPEAGYAAMDFYTCGDHTDPNAAFEHAAMVLGAQLTVSTQLTRGVPIPDGGYTHRLSRRNLRRS